MIPVRCFTCGKVIAHLWEEYEHKVKTKVDSATALESIGLSRYCCRRMFLSHVDMTEQLIHLSQHVDTSSRQKNLSDSNE